MKIGMLLSPASESFRPVAHLTEPNKRAYAANWGIPFSFPVHTRDPEAMPWERITLMQDALGILPLGSWLLFMGADTVFTNPRLSAAEVFDGPGDLLFAVDENGLQSDVMMLRHCPAVMGWLERVLYYRGRARCEQDAMSVALSGALNYPMYRGWFHAREEANGGDREAAHSFLLNRTDCVVRILPKRSINSTKADWMPGDFIFHAAGLAHADRIEALRHVLGGLE